MEAAKFTPNLLLVIWHGLDRHERREEVVGADLVVTTYTVLARDIEIMRGLEWQIIVLDESQAIKNPEAKWSRAVRQLNARHHLCLSGTPVENNLGEIWSQFAFLMPGLLGDRRRFTRRFRTPIEKNGDDARRLLLARRLKPFLLRRTKDEVEADLPAKSRGNGSCTAARSMASPQPCKQPLPPGIVVRLRCSAGVISQAAVAGDSIPGSNRRRPLGADQIFSRVGFPVRKIVASRRKVWTA